MDSKIAREVIGVIRAERRRRSDQLKDEDPDVAYDQWVFTDEPFINEMCLMVLAALHHQVERELVLLAAGANCGPTITSQQYRMNVNEWRKKVRKKPELLAALGLQSFPEFVETLRLLANCLKHEPHQHPGEVLLRHLNLPDVNQLKKQDALVAEYLPLAESDRFREGLAASVSLPKETDYLTIADKFAELVSGFLKGMRKKANVARVTGIKISFAG